VVPFAFFYDISSDSGCSVDDTNNLRSQSASNLINVLGHELFEAITDPTLISWFDDYGEENADKCGVRHLRSPFGSDRLFSTVVFRESLRDSHGRRAVQVSGYVVESSLSSTERQRPAQWLHRLKHFFLDSKNNTSRCLSSCYSSRSPPSPPPPRTSVTT
jgi:hypothetical protein